MYARKAVDAKRRAEHALEQLEIEDDIAMDIIEPIQPTHMRNAYMLIFIYPVVCYKWSDGHLIGQDVHAWLSHSFSDKVIKRLVMATHTRLLYSIRSRNSCT